MVIRRTRNSALRQQLYRYCLYSVIHLHFPLSTTSFKWILFINNAGILMYSGYTSHTNYNQNLPKRINYRSVLHTLRVAVPAVYASCIISHNGHSCGHLPLIFSTIEVLILPVSKHRHKDNNMYERDHKNGKAACAYKHFTQ